MVIGHEPLGVVEEVGSAVVSIRKGTGWWCPRTSAAASALTVYAAITEDFGVFQGEGADVG